MKPETEKKIRKRLRVIYRDAGAEEKAFRAVEKKLAHYRETEGEPVPFSQNDSILITYGDTVRDGEMPTLKVLGRFLDTYVKDAVDAVHILPMYPYTSDDGFSVTDYRKIRPDLGGWPDIESLSRRYRLMFDAVINHISRSSEWFQGYLECREPYRDFFITCDPDADYSRVIRPRTLPLLTEVQTSEGKKHVWTTFSEDQIDLNYRSPELLAEIIDILLMYTERGAAYVRLDAIGFLWKEPGTACMHLEQTHEVIKMIKDIFKVYAPQTRIITETNVPQEDNKSYFGKDADEADLIYQFPLPPLVLYTLLTGDASVLSEWLEHLDPPDTGVTYFNFLSSHDGIGVRPAEGILSEKQIKILLENTLRNGGGISYRDNGDGTKSPYELNINYQDALASPDESDEERISKFLAAQTILLSLQGVPGIYIHSLLGSRNDYYGEAVSGIPRRINREKLSYQYISEQLEKETNRNRIFTELMRRLRIRRRERAFSPGAKQTVINICPQVLCLKRENEKTGGQIYVLINVSDKEIFVKKDEIRGIDLLSGEKVEGELRLDPWECRWIRL